MPFVALEWDHKIGRPMINWIVVECSGVAERCGAAIALPPRRDVAYFVDEKTAERDAKAFAEYKNAQQEGRSVTAAGPVKQLRWHATYPWDHHIFNPLLRWGVFEWPGEGAKPGPRTDVAYFLDPETAQADAEWLCWDRERWLSERKSALSLTLSRKAG